MLKYVMALPYLTLPYLQGGQVMRPYQLGPMHRYVMALLLNAMQNLHTKEVESSFIILVTGEVRRENAGEAKCSCNRESHTSV